MQPTGAIFLALTSLFLPLAALRSARRVRRAPQPPSRATHLTSFAVSQAILLFPALLAARYEGIRLFPPLRLGPENAGIVLAFLVTTLGTLPLRWRWKPREERARVLWMLPRSTRDLAWWLGVALIAGVVEEIAYRGAMFVLWRRALGIAPAFAICAGAFALAHAAQGWRAMVVILGIALVSHGIVLATGDLYTAMIAHATYDLLAGALLLRLARRDGLLPASAEASPRAADPPGPA